MSGELTLEQRITRLEEQEAKRQARWRTLILCIRQVLIMALGGIEDHEQMERSIVPRRKR